MSVVQFTLTFPISFSLSQAITHHHSPLVTKLLPTYKDSQIFPLPQAFTYKTLIDNNKYPFYSEDYAIKYTK